MFTAEQVDKLFLDLVNNERRRNGLNPVTLNAQLDEAAQRHSEDLAFNDWYNEANPHIGSDGSTRISRVRDTGYRYESPQGEPFENIAVGQFTPQEAFEDWLKSSGHRENILTPNVNHLGVGHTFLENDTGTNNYFDYWLIVLAKGQPAPAPVPTPPVLEIPEIAIPEEIIEPETPVVEPPDETLVLEPPTTETPENVPVVETPDSEAEASGDETTTPETPDTSEETVSSNPDAEPPVSDTPDSNVEASDPETETSDETITSDIADPNTETPAESAETDTSTDTSQDEVVVSQPSDESVQDSSTVGTGESQSSETPSTQTESTGLEEPTTPSQNNTDEATSTTADSSGQSEGTSVDTGNQSAITDTDIVTTDSVVEVIESPSNRPVAVAAGRNETSQQETVSSPQTLLGTEGDDSLEAGPETTLVAGGWGNDRITGSDNDDVLRGDLNERAPSGGIKDGDDLIFGGAGNDYIGGKGGNDTLVGGTGNDMIWGDDGDDILRGGLGNDTLTGDNFSGGSGADTFILAAGAGTDLIMDFELGTDRIGLADGLTFADLSFGQSDGMATISLTNGGEVLAEVKDVMPDALTNEMFTVI
ncbi:MAG: CAP domain-containing protein [Cyanobacteria bacterium P01_D01_bin.56]